MRQRVITSVLLAPIVLAAVALTWPWPVFLLCAIALFIALTEIRSMLAHRITSFTPALLFLLLSNLFLTKDDQTRRLLVAVGALMFMLGVISAYITARRGKSNPVGETLDGLWPAMPLFLLLALHQSHLEGGTWQVRSPLLLALLPVWAGDIAAIFVGRAVGKHLLAPSISPKKTWEGAAGNLLAAILVGGLLGVWNRLGLETGLAAGLAVGIVGQIGDLFESYVKRRAGMKDSGTLLPGHGGIMDRIDSILFSAPAVALIVFWLR